MNVVRLSKTTYLPDALVEGYSSMIWTERYTPAGEFEMKTPLIEKTQEIIPKESLISLLDTDEVMIVEDHIIETDDTGTDQLTIKGRTFDTFLEQRDSDTSLPNTEFYDNLPGKKPDTVFYAGQPENWFLPGPWDDNGIMYTPAQAAAYLMWINIVENLQFPPLGTTGGDADYLPNVVVTNSSGTGSAATRQFPMTYGNKYEKIQEILERYDLGVRSIRPPSSNVYTVSFDGSPAGTYVRTLKQTLNKLRLDVYKGVNRTAAAAQASGGTLKPVIFDAAVDLSKGTYLDTIKNFKNVAYVYSPLGKVVVLAPGLSDEPTGLDRRVLHVDASNLTKVGKNTSAGEMLSERGIQELRHHNKQFYVDCEILPTTKYKYRKQYGLGDRVTVRGKYGYRETMIVSEFVRTEDENGERAFPTLVRPDAEG